MVQLFNSTLNTVEPGPEVDDTYHIVCPVSPMELEQRGEPLSRLQWEASHDQDGKIISPLSIRDKIFKGVSFLFINS